MAGTGKTELIIALQRTMEILGIPFITTSSAIAVQSICGRTVLAQLRIGCLGKKDGYRGIWRFRGEVNNCAIHLVDEISMLG